MNSNQNLDDEDEEIREYMNRFKNMSAEEILASIQQLNQFFIKNMTKEGKEIFFKERGIKLP